MKVIAFVLWIIFSIVACYDTKETKVHWLWVLGMVMFFILLMEHGVFQPGDIPEDPRR